MPEISITTPRGAAQWLRLYRLYHRAFPASERKPFAVIVKMYRKGKSDIWQIRQDGKFAALAFTINGENLILLDYFAVARNCRGRGIGSAALGELRKRYAGKGMFVEIESTGEAADNQQERLRRKQFYLSNGMRPLNVTVMLFGVKMELLGIECEMDFPRYHAFYRDNYSAWAADRIAQAQ